MTHRHLVLVRVLKPTSQLVCDFYYEKMSAKICLLRSDSLGLMMLYGNVRSGANVIVMEQSQGLVTAAVVSRLGGTQFLLACHVRRVSVNPLPLQFQF